MTSMERFNSFKPIVPSQLAPRLHPKANEVIQRVEEWFLKHWPFPNESVREEFRSGDLALFICWSMPDGLIERMDLVCKMGNALFLIDDGMDYWSMEEVQNFCKTFAGLVMGDGDIHPVTQLEKIMHSLFAEIRGIPIHGQDFCEDVIRWFKAATSHARPQWKSSGDFMGYCEYRIEDVGYWLTNSLMRCAMDLQHSKRGDEAVNKCDHLAGIHAMLVNDLFSYRREALISGKVGAALINAVPVVQNGRGINEQEAILWLARYCEEVEKEFEEVALTTAARRLGEDTDRHIGALRLLMAGNLKWSTICGRYKL